MAFQIPLLKILLVALFSAAYYRHKDEMSLATFLLLTASFGSVVWAAYRSFVYPFYVSPLRHVPTVPGCPLWGHFFQIVTHEVGFLQREWHMQHGPIIRYFFPFGGERLSVAEEDALNEMTKRDPYNFPKPDRVRTFMRSVLGNGVLNEEGAEHHRQRKILSPAFSTRCIEQLAPVFWKKAVALSDKWRSQANGDNGIELEVLADINSTTLDIISEAAFGYKLDSINKDNPLRAAYARVTRFDLASRVVIGLLSLSMKFLELPLKINSEIKDSIRVVQEYADDIVRCSSRQEKGGKDIMSLIIETNNEEQRTSVEGGMSTEQLSDQVKTFLGAGHDTTATGVAWTLLLLAKNPEMQQRLRAEIQTHVPALSTDSGRTDFLSQLNIADAKDLPDMQRRLDQLPYLSNVCRESLRYIPPIPQTVRCSVRDCMLGRYFVPAGTMIYILSNTINRMPSFWGPDADVFQPDRWDKLPKDWSSNGFMTFLHGPRGCIGRKFAEQEMKVFVCTLLTAFEFEPAWKEDPEDNKCWRLVLRPGNGIELRVKLLRSSSKSELTNHAMDESDLG